MGLDPATPAAFFDLDRTLLDLNSGAAYARFEYREGRIGLLDLGRSACWMGLYHLSLIDMDRAYRKAVRYYAGLPASELEARTRRWFNAEMLTHLRPGAREALKRHRDQGHPLVLLTASSCYASRMACDQWGLDDYLANDFATDAQGALTGEVSEPLCFAEGKVVRARRWAAEHGVDLQASWFYTDSLSDLPMLEAVGHPVLVHPDPRLSRVGRQRGWPREDWGSGP